MIQIGIFRLCKYTLSPAVLYHTPPILDHFYHNMKNIKADEIKMEEFDKNLAEVVINSSRKFDNRFSMLSKMQIQIKFGRLIVLVLYWQ